MKLLLPLFRRVRRFFRRVRRSPGAGYDTPAAPPRALLHSVTVLAVAVPALLVAILAAISLFPLQPARAAGPTAVPGGTLSGSTTWTRAGSPYLVSGVVFVPSGVTLTVEPGTEVRFGSLGTNSYIAVESGGSFVAQGLVTQPITLTSGSATPRPGDWEGIKVRYGGRLRLRYCEVGYGGDSLYIASSDVEVRDCTVRDGGGNGILLDHWEIEPVFENVTLTNNLKAGAYNSQLASPRYRNVTIAGNGTDAVVVRSGDVYVDMTLDGSGLNGRPFVIRKASIGGVSPLGIAAGRALTIAAGTEVRFEANTGILVGAAGQPVGGRLVAEGTPAQPITLTSAEAVPRAGDWSFVVGALGGTARLAYCDVRYSGGLYYGQASASLHSQEGDVQVRNCRIRDGAGDGIRLYDNYHYTKPVLENVAITGHPGAAVRQWVNADAPYRGLSASGNGVDAVVLDTSTTVAGRTRLGPAGIPYRVDGTLQVGVGTLVLEPGADVRFSPAGMIDAYQGILQVTGSVSQPVTLTAVSGVAGGWRGVRIASGATAILQYCDLSYGGASAQALLHIVSNNTVVQNCRIRGSAGDGIRVSYVRPSFIGSNQIFSNTVGLSVTGVGNWGAEPQVDARGNWWGDPSGPSGAPSNPLGKGDRIGPGVRFDPWLRSPETGSVSLGRLLVDVHGPRFVSPGQTVDYLLPYANLLSRTVESAVVVFTLPFDADYQGSTDDGIFWPERQQVFWRLGNLSPGASGAVSVRVRYFWGLPNGLPVEALAILVGSNAGQSAFDVDAYQRYAAKTVASSVPLTDDEISRERQGSVDYDTLYRDATAAGFTAAGAGRLTYNDGSVVTQTILISRKGTVLLRRKATDVQSVCRRFESGPQHPRNGVFPPQTRSPEPSTPGFFVLL